MGDGTGIEWTEATWNPVLGCEKVTAGCDGCYAISTAHRFDAHPNPKVRAAYEGLTVDTEDGVDWTGIARMLPDRLDKPIRWTRPRRIFVNSMSDLFHKDVTDDFIARVFAVMALSPQHTFQILTKRHSRMRSLLNNYRWWTTVVVNALEMGGSPQPTQTLADGRCALPNVWIGVSVEDQRTAELRIPALIATPAAVRWLSCEPLLGPIDLFARSSIDTDPGLDRHSAIDWIVVGGESGTRARPMHPAWARTLRAQAQDARIPFLFKQWGEWAPEAMLAHDDDDPAAFLDAHGTFRALVDGMPEHAPYARGGAMTMRRAGKKHTGRLLDGVLHNDYPERVR